MELQNLTPPQELETLSLELTSVFSIPRESAFKEAGTWNLTPLVSLCENLRTWNLEVHSDLCLWPSLRTWKLELGNLTPMELARPLSLLSWELGTWNLELGIYPLVRSDSERMNWISHDGKLSHHP